LTQRFPKNLCPNFAKEPLGRKARLKIQNRSTTVPIALLWILTKNFPATYTRTNRSIRGFRRVFYKMVKTHLYSWNPSLSDSHNEDDILSTIVNMKKKKISSMPVQPPRKRVTSEPNQASTPTRGCCCSSGLCCVRGSVGLAFTTMCGLLSHAKAEWRRKVTRRRILLSLSSSFVRTIFRLCERYLHRSM
jgi:hypothetical protein